MHLLLFSLPYHNSLKIKAVKKLHLFTDIRYFSVGSHSSIPTNVLIWYATVMDRAATKDE
jgi:hypothetical protein